MFDFLMDFGNYEQRKVGRDDYPWGFISTARVSDGAKPYETAVLHKAYGDNMTIVESYNNKKDAIEGHARWIAMMAAKKLPSKLTDCMNSKVAQCLETISGKKITKRRRKTAS